MGCKETCYGRLAFGKQSRSPLVVLQAKGVMKQSGPHAARTLWP